MKTISLFDIFNSIGSFKMKAMKIADLFLGNVIARLVKTIDEGSPPHSD